jgi:hypothetical protein
MGSTATATRPKGKSKKKLSPEAKFCRDYIEDACDNSETLAAVIGALTKTEYRSFLGEMTEMCDTYAEALYGDDEDGDDADD